MEDMDIRVDHTANRVKRERLQGSSPANGDSHQRSPPCRVGHEPAPGFGRGSRLGRMEPRL